MSGRASGAHHWPRDGTRLAWIFGSSRSGSTWLLKMLAASGEITPIDDPHIGHHLGVWRPIPLAWAVGNEVPELTTLTEVKRDNPDYFFCDRYRDSWFGPLRDLIASRFEAQAKSTATRSGEAPLVVAKEPGSHAAELLTELFPRSSMIFLLRDGRDVVDSWLDAYREGTWAQEEGAFAVEPEGRIALVRWLASVWRFRTETVQRAYESHPPERRLAVRYEDLRRDTAGELERISWMLGLGTTTTRLAEIATDCQFENVQPGARGDGKVVRIATPGSWRQRLSAEELDALAEIIGPKLSELGYPDAYAGRPIRSVPA